MKKLLATVLAVVLMAGVCALPVCAYGSEAATLGELLSEYDYTAEGLSFEISTSFHENVNSSLYYDIRSDNAEAQLEGTYYPVADISAVIEILSEDSDSVFEDVYYRDDNGDVSVVEQSEDYYSWGRERVLIRTTDGSLPRLTIFLDSSGDSCLLCWETGKGCKLSDGAYDKVVEALGIANLSEEDAITYTYYPLPDGLDEDIVEDVNLSTNDDDWGTPSYDEDGEPMDIATEETDEPLQVEDYYDDEEETNPTTGTFLLLSMPVMALGAVFATKKRK
ncbi:MAG: hypothetical protein LUH56_02385 [Oscillospiraceae bacterium]|nr:hypothetical protein [Oscillospiraceae bacterium]